MQEHHLFISLLVLMSSMHVLVKTYVIEESATTISRSAGTSFDIA